MPSTRNAILTACGFAVAAALTAVGPARLRAAKPSAASAPRELSLLVGISDYKLTPENPQPPEWWPLNCGNDLGRLKSALRGRFGFPEGDIRLLADKAATRKGIEDAFREHLIDQVHPGDIVYFHYSGHGQQILDDNGDEIDELDESLITADYKSQSAKDGYDTNLRDQGRFILILGLTGFRATSRDGIRNVVSRRRSYVPSDGTGKRRCSSRRPSSASPLPSGSGWHLRGAFRRALRAGRSRCPSGRGSAPRAPWPRPARAASS